jgi:hypothetical protein
LIVTPVSTRAGVGRGDDLKLVFASCDDTVFHVGNARMGEFEMVGALRIMALGAGMLLAVQGAANAAERTRDLAEVAQGQYAGDVISDARGPSREGVAITVTRIAPDTVRVSSNYGRMPTFTVPLTRAMQTIQQARGDNVFLLDLAKSPPLLMVTVDSASWAGARTGELARDDAANTPTCKDVTQGGVGGGHFALASCR